MVSGIVGPTLGAAQLAATLSGVPFAAGGVMVLQMINAACTEVALHKQKSAQLVRRCATLLNHINEQSSQLAGTDAAAAFDEAEHVLSGVYRRIQKWADCGKLKRFVNRGQIANDLDWCYAEVEIAMERLHLANPVSVLRMQQRSIDMMQELQQLIISPREIEYAAQQHFSGGNAAHDLMRSGQERLVRLREDAPVPSATILSDGQQVDQPPTPSAPPSPVITAQNQIEQALLDLHRLTNIPPTIPILNHQVRQTSPVCIRSGLYSQIYEGRWLGEKKVALKTLRILGEDDPKLKKLQTRFEHEITVWSKLKHENVLTMLGIVTNMGPIHIVSPWQLDNVRNYRTNNLNVNPLKLLSQAARGLEYLHDQQIVHGNLKCANVLVSEDGVVTLSDFGLTQVLTDVVGRQAMIILTNLSAVRWHAPELCVGEETPPTMASDVFAFGMSVLELLTMKDPYSHRKRDVTVLQDIVAGVLPPRPEEPVAASWMSDELWEMLNRWCWEQNAEERILAKELPARLEQASESLTR